MHTYDDSLNLSFLSTSLYIMLTPYNILYRLQQTKILSTASSAVLVLSVLIGSLAWVADKASENPTAGMHYYGHPQGSYRASETLITMAYVYLYLVWLVLNWTVIADGLDSVQ